MTPLISVGIPVCNGERYLEGCLRSVLDQTIVDLEVVVADNASQDRSVEIARDIAADDHRVRVLESDENRGAAWNYNRLVAATSAPYFCWTAHDDEREPDGLAACLEALRAGGPTTVLAYTRTVFIDEHGEVIARDRDRLDTHDPRPHRRLATVLRRLNLASPLLGLLRRSALERTRLIAPFTASDYVLQAELAILGGIVEVPMIGFRRRLHPESSRAAATSRHEVQAWFDPSKHVSRLSDRTKLLVEYHRSAWRLAPTRAERLKCVAVIVPARTYKRSRVAGGALKDRILGPPVHESRSATFSTIDPARERLTPCAEEPKAG